MLRMIRDTRYAIMALRIAYHAYRVSCVTLGKMEGHEKKCNSKFILYIY